MTLGRFGNLPVVKGKVWFTTWLAWVSNPWVTRLGKGPGEIRYEIIMN